MSVLKKIVATSTFLIFLVSTNTAFSLDIKQVVKVQTKGGNLNVRYGPGKRKIGTIKSGTPVQITRTVGKGRNKWARIKWAKKIGWVSRKYLKSVASVDTSKTYQVNASALNMRKGAGRNNTKLRTLVRGTSGIKILKVKNVRGTYWANISQGGKKGWVSAKYLKVASAGKSAGSTAGATQPKTQYYTVKRGDTLYGVQRKTKKNWAKIAGLNNIDYPYTLNPGQKLRLP